MAVPFTEPTAAYTSSLQRPASIVHGSSSDDGSDSDHAPLFDPSGLSSTVQPSDSGAVAGVDLNSHAAVRLGLSPPPPSSRSTIQPMLQRMTSTSRFKACEAPSSMPNPVLRGRRRRSSEYLLTLPQDSVITNDDPFTTRTMKSFSAQRERPTLAINPEDCVTDSSAPDRQSSFSPSPASSGRSPAADFLSSFGAFNSIVHPAQGSEWPSSSSMQDGSRCSTPSTGRSREPSVASQLLVDRTSSRSSERITNGFQPMSGVAAELMTKTNSQASLSKAFEMTGSFDPEVSGSTFGPGGRYELGKVLGFGGFSTIREGLDRGSLAAGGGSNFKVAIKLIYKDAALKIKDAEHEREQELSVWRSLPAHPHLLPLLYDETMTWSQGDATHPNESPLSSTGGEGQVIQLLVMPLCEGGNLLDYVKTEGGRRISCQSAVSLSRSQSLTNHGSMSPSPSSSPYQTRPGSGFLNQRNSSNISAALSKTSSTTGIVRRSSSSIPRSQGVSLTTARDILRQVAEGLHCLHQRVKVVHGDLKLENVLAEVIPDDQRASPVQPSGNLKWRLADFGLSKKIEDYESKTPSERVPFFCRRSSSRPRPGKGFQDKTQCNRPGAHVRNAPWSSRLGQMGGGSLAYTPPEIWREGSIGSTPTGDEAGISPFASDMWALGCIAYALVSGKMPFNDTFEPRLQAKIAKGEWEVPPRLWRRAKRLASAAAAAAAAAAASSSVSPSRGGGGYLHSVSGRFSESRGSASQRSSFGSLSEHDRMTDRQLKGVPLAVHIYSGADFSASLPSLPNAEHHAARILNRDAAAAHDAPIVGSVPSRPEAPHRFDIDAVAQAAADAEADSESDDEPMIDQTWDGTSGERAAVRALLRGLLEPEPSKRWTTNQLLECRWLTSSNGPFLPQRPASVRGRLPNVTEGIALGEENRARGAVIGNAGSFLAANRSQWGREMSWRTELTFERVDSVLKDEDAKQPNERASSLTRSRPSGGSQTPSNASNSRSKSRSQHNRGGEAEVADVQENLVVDSSIVVHRSGMSSSVAPFRGVDGGTDSQHSRSKSPSISRQSTPSRQVEIRGRRQRVVHPRQNVDEMEMLLLRAQAGARHRGRDPAPVQNSAKGISTGEQRKSAKARSSSTPRLGLLDAKTLARPSSLSSFSSSISSTASLAPRNSDVSYASAISPQPDTSAKTKRSRSRPPMLSSYCSSGFGGASGAAFPQQSNFPGSPTDHRGPPTVSSFTQSSTRSSTSRSHSRAPDALAHLLGTGLGAVTSASAAELVPGSSGGSQLLMGPNGSPTVSERRGRDERCWDEFCLPNSPQRRSRGISMSGPIYVPRSAHASHVAELGMDEVDDDDKDGDSTVVGGRWRKNSDAEVNREHGRGFRR